MATVRLYGVLVDYDACVNLMDDQLREELHAEMAPCTEQEFLDMYVARHFLRFGENFLI